MEKQQAKDLVRETFESPFQYFMPELLVENHSVKQLETET